MRKSACATVIVPSPECWILHLERHSAAQALAGDNRAARQLPGFHRTRTSLETCSTARWGQAPGAYKEVHETVIGLRRNHDTRAVLAASWPRLIPARKENLRAFKFGRVTWVSMRGAIPG